MPSKKNAVNGFWLFAQKNKGTWRNQGLRVGTNDELLRIANPLWKSLPIEERKRWDQLGKEERGLLRADGGRHRLDNTGRPLENRVNLAEEARKKRERDIQRITAGWHGKDLTRERFYFLNFQDMLELTESDNNTDRQWLPRELAMLEYSLTEGIVQFYHQFIWPEGIPMGARAQAMKVSEEIHKIPIERMEEDSVEFRKIWREMLQLVQAGVKDGQYPPLFCLNNDYDKMQYLIDWMWEKSGSDLNKPNPLGRVCSLEDMVCSLMAASGKPDTDRLSKTQIASHLDGSQWEYLPGTSCDFHKKEDVSRHCALAVVRRTAYTVSDMVGIHYNIQLTDKHVPVRDDKEMAGMIHVLPKEALPMYSRPRRAGRGRGRATSPPAPRKSYSQLAQGRQGFDRYATSGDNDEDDDDDFSGQENETGLLSRLGTARNQQGISPFGGQRYSALNVPPSYPTSEPSSDWPALGSGRTKPSHEGSSLDATDEEFPALNMSNMTLSSASSDWLVSGGRGVTVGSSDEPIVQPPPGFNSTDGAWSFPQEPVGMGRGAAPLSASRLNDPIATSSAPSLGRGMPPQFGRGAVQPGQGRGAPPLAVGRGTAPLGISRGPSPLGVGRGAAPPAAGGDGFSIGRGEMPSVGRGAMAVGRGEMSTGRGIVAAVGRGEMPSAARGGTVTAVGRGQMPSAQRASVPAVGTSGLPVVAGGQAPFPTSACAADWNDDDDFEPAPSSVTSVLPPPQLGRGNSPGRVGSGANVGRGFNPNRGRGYAPGTQGAV